MENKHLSPRLAVKWFGMLSTTVYRHVAIRYATKFGAGRVVVGAVFGEGRQKSIVRSYQLLPQQALVLQHAY